VNGKGIYGPGTKEYTHPNCGKRHLGKVRKKEEVFLPRGKAPSISPGRKKKKKLGDRKK